MADPIEIVRHIRVGGRTLCGLKCQPGIHVVAWSDHEKGTCPDCTRWWEQYERESHDRARRSNQAKFVNAPRVK